MITTNPRKFWNVINPQESHDITLTNDNGDSVSDVQCADIFNTAFSSVFTIEPEDTFLSLPSITELAMPAIIFHPNGISCAIDKLKISSSAGTDEINTKFLKNTKDISSKFLCLLFSQSLATGIIPEDWKMGKVVPVFKSGNRDSPLNYRPFP